MRHLGQFGNHAIQRRQHDLLTRALAHEGMRQVVDVFRGASKVDELADLGNLGIALGLVLDPVLQRFNIMVGRGFDALHSGSIGFGEVVDQTIQLGNGGRRERRNFSEMRFSGQRLEPFDLDPQTSVNQPVFGEVRTQGVNLGGIAAIQWGKGGQRTEVLRHVMLLNP